MQLFRMRSCFLVIRLHKEHGSLDSTDLDSVFHVCVTAVNQYRIDVDDKTDVYARKLDVLNRGLSGYNTEWSIPVFKKVTKP